MSEGILAFAFVLTELALAADIVIAIPVAVILGALVIVADVRARRAGTPGPAAGGVGSEAPPEQAVRAPEAEPATLGPTRAVRARRTSFTAWAVIGGALAALVLATAATALQDIERLSALGSTVGVTALFAVDLTLVATLVLIVQVIALVVEMLRLRRTAGAAVLVPTGIAGLVYGGISVFFLLGNLMARPL